MKPSPTEDLMEALRRRRAPRLLDYPTEEGWRQHVYEMRRFAYEQPWERPTLAEYLAEMLAKERAFDDDDAKADVAELQRELESAWDTIASLEAERDELLGRLEAE